MKGKPPQIVALRNYDPQSRTLLGPSFAVGNCQAPTIPAGSIAWFDTGLQASIGDYVLARFSPPQSQSSLMVKRLGEYRGRRVLLSNTMPPIVLNQDFTIVATMVCFVITGRDIYADQTAQADAEAAELKADYLRAVQDARGGTWSKSSGVAA